MTVHTTHRCIDFVRLDKVSGSPKDLVVMAGAGGEVPPKYGNVVYDISGAGEWVSWSSTGSPDSGGTSYPGPGTPPGDWKTGSYSFYSIF